MADSAAGMTGADGLVVRGAARHVSPSLGASRRAGTRRLAYQAGDLEAVVESLGLRTIVPVAHDSSGIVALDYALAHQGAVGSVVMLNSAFAEDDTVLWPEMITLFATGSLRALAMEVAQSPAQFGWLLTWQQGKFREALPEGLRPGMDAFIGPLVAENFVAQSQRSADDLIAAARELFATTGVNATIRETADRAGVGKGTLFRRFPQRADLIAAVFDSEASV